MLGRFELTGGSIINVVHYSCLKAISTGKEKIVNLKDVLKGIKKEVEKEGKVFRDLLNKE